MNDIIDVQSNEQKAQGLKNIGWISYVLHLIVAVGAVLPGAQASALLLVIALVLDLVKRGDAEGTWQANHFSWRIRTVIWAGVLYIVTAPFWLLGLFLFNPVWVVISLWFLYRIVRGMLAMSKNQAVDA